jgi:ferredoxin-thioredoxin reductase catalytic subunit
MAKKKSDKPTELKEKKPRKKSLDRILKEFQEEHSLVLGKYADLIIRGLKHNKKEYGDYYCPVSRHRDNEHICPCNLKSECPAQFFNRREQSEQSSGDEDPFRELFGESEDQMVLPISFAEDVDGMEA